MNAELAALVERAAQDGVLKETADALAAEQAAREKAEEKEHEKDARRVAANLSAAGSDYAAASDALGTALDALATAAEQHHISLRNYRRHEREARSLGITFHAEPSFRDTIHRTLEGRQRRERWQAALVAISF